MKKSLFIIPFLVLALLLTACGGNKTPDTPDQPDVSATAGEATEGDSTTTAKGDKTTKTGNKTQVTNNVVNWEDFFGDEAPTTKKGETTTTTKKTTTKKTTTAPTKKPTVIDKVTLPAVGTDVDGRGRIKVSHVSLKKGVLTIKIRNYTDEQKTQWITEETDYVNYACYDSEGKALSGSDSTYGFLYLGCLEAGEETTFTLALPKGTAKVELIGAKVVYWTPWS